MLVQNLKLKSIYYTNWTDKDSPPIAVRYIAEVDAKYPYVFIVVGNGDELILSEEEVNKFVSPRRPVKNVPKKQRS